MTDHRPGLVFLDTETTGLDPDTHEVLELAWAVDDGPIRTVRLAHTLTGADPMALKVNRYLERGFAALQGAVFDDPPSGMDLFVADVTGRTVVAENVAFDLSMLRVALYGEKPWHYRPVELSSIAMHVFGLPHPEGLRATADRLRACGIPIAHNDHTAAGDVACLRDCYRALRAHP